MSYATIAVTGAAMVLARLPSDSAGFSFSFACFDLTNTNRVEEQLVERGLVERLGHRTSPESLLKLFSPEREASLHSVHFICAAGDKPAHRRRRRRTRPSPAHRRLSRNRSLAKYVRCGQRPGQRTAALSAPVSGARVRLGGRDRDTRRGCRRRRGKYIRSSRRGILQRTSLAVHP